MEGDCCKWSIDYYIENRDKCNEIINSLENFDQIPLLTTENFHYFEDGELVRYIGMIQDVHNPEYYYQTFTCHKPNGGGSVVKSGLYRDIATSEPNEKVEFDKNSLDQRSVFFCIPIPFMSSWVEDYSKKSLKIKGSSSDSTCKKRSLSDTEDGNVIEIEDDLRIKKECSTTNHDKNLQSGSHSVDSYFPLHVKNGLPCIVKMYGKEDEYNVFVHHRIEVIGFLSINPALESDEDDCDDEGRMLNPPPSLVPRLHSIFYRQLEHNNPLLNKSSITSEIKSCASEIRNGLHFVLTQILYGDSLAAEYMICYLLSTVYARSDDQPLGKFNINLYNITDENYGSRLCEFLETIVTNIQYIPMTLEILNETQFNPKRNYELNKTKSGRLQLCDGTYLIVDETKLNTGKLGATGCRNLYALHNLILNEEVFYDFSYFSVKFDMNIPVLVLSTAKAMLEADVRIQIKPEPSALAKSLDEMFAPAFSFLQNEEVCKKIRIYITCMKHLKFEISEDMTRIIAQEYTKLRQEKTGINPDDLHNLLVLSRLLALSYGTSSLAVEHWTRAIEMDLKRKERSN